MPLPRRCHNQPFAHVSLLKVCISGANHICLDRSFPLFVVATFGKAALEYKWPQKETNGKASNDPDTWQLGMHLSKATTQLNSLIGMKKVMIQPQFQRFGYDHSQKNQEPMLDEPGEYRCASRLGVRQLAGIYGGEQKPVQVMNHESPKDRKSKSDQFHSKKQVKQVMPGKEAKQENCA